MRVLHTVRLYVHCMCSVCALYVLRVLRVCLHILCSAAACLIACLIASLYVLVLTCLVCVCVFSRCSSLSVFVCWFLFVSMVFSDPSEQTQRASGSDVWLRFVSFECVHVRMHACVCVFLYCVCEFVCVSAFSLFIIVFARLFCARAVCMRMCVC